MVPRIVLMHQSSAGMRRNGVPSEHRSQMVLVKAAAPLTTIAPEEDEMGRLTTHVLDTAAGVPGKGIRITLLKIVDNRRETLKTLVTNHDGRCDQPLLEKDALQVGVYELEFSAGEYFRARGVTLPEPAFLDVVTLRFGIADVTAHYHVPLLVSPWSYSTYRGS